MEMPRRIRSVDTDPEFKRRLGRRIYEARKDADLTQAELAKLIDASTTWVTNIERGDFNVDLGVMVKLAEKLQKPIDWFLRSEPHVPSRFRVPSTRAEWEVMFKNDPKRAAAHAALDEICLELASLRNRT
jgi:transcriptional regulator with XRE-family HTH domain